MGDTPAAFLGAMEVVEVGAAAIMTLFVRGPCANTHTHTVFHGALARILLVVGALRHSM